MRFSRTTILLIILTVLVPYGYPQGNQLTEHQARAAYLYNFIKFVNWPDTAFDSADQPIRTVFFGESEVEKEFKQVISGRMINDRKIEVDVINSIRELDDCHIIYLNDLEKRYQISIINALRNRPVLTVSNAEYFSRIGGMIHFIIVDEHLRFEINRSAVESVHLEVSAMLLRVARVVE